MDRVLEPPCAEGALNQILGRRLAQKSESLGRFE